MSAILRAAETDAEIAACFPAMQELRPHLTDAARFVSQARRQYADGYRLLAAWEGSSVIGVAGYRMTENMIRGRFCYVDDLVVLAAERRSGLGALLLDGVVEAARADRIGLLVLDTGLDNRFAQRFYFRYGMLASGLHFTKPVV